MTTKGQDRILDFAATGMWWEITKSTAETDGEFFEAINVIEPGFAGPPLHIHPHAEENGSTFVIRASPAHLNTTDPHGGKPVLFLQPPFPVAAISPGSYLSILCDATNVA